MPVLVGIFQKVFYQPGPHACTHQSMLLQSTPSPLSQRIWVHLDLTEMVSRLLKPRQICTDQTSLLRVVTVPHTEFRRQLVVSMVRCLATALAPLRGTVTTSWRRHQCHSLAACRISFLLWKRRSNRVVAGHRQYRMLIRARCIQYANLLNARPWITVRMDHRHRATWAVTFLALPKISESYRLRPLHQFPDSVFLQVRLSVLVFLRVRSSALGNLFLPNGLPVPSLWADAVLRRVWILPLVQEALRVRLHSP